MASIHSTRTCLPKLCCSLAAVGLFIAGILITGAYPHSNRDNFGLNQTHKEQDLTSPGNFTLAAERLAFIKAENKDLCDQIDKAVDRFGKSIQRIPELADRISRSPRAVKPIQEALDRASAIFEQSKPEPEYQQSHYATSNRRRWKRSPRAGRNESPEASTTYREETNNEWFLQNLATSPFPITAITALGTALHLATGIKRYKREPSVYPFKITDLLEYEVRKKHSQNKILGEKIAKILHQNTDLSDEIAAEYQTPSQKLKKDPIMALVTRILSTYMLVKHSKNAKDISQEDKRFP
jgi:hypothetical protein